LFAGIAEVTKKITITPVTIPSKLKYGVILFKHMTLVRHTVLVRQIYSSERIIGRFKYKTMGNRHNFNLFVRSFKKSIVTFIFIEISFIGNILWYMNPVY
jgi:hypothetical protein